MRVLSENEREHKENMESLHLSSEKEILQSQSLQEYAAYNFISLSHVSCLQFRIMVCANC